MLRELAAELNIADVHLLNDLEANAHGIAELGPKRFCHAQRRPAPIRAETPPSFPPAPGWAKQAFISTAGNCIRLPAKGATAISSPRDELETELLIAPEGKICPKQRGHVSYERVLSGPGLRQHLRIPARHRSRQGIARAGGGNGGGRSCGGHLEGWPRWFVPTVRASDGSVRLVLRRRSRQFGTQNAGHARRLTSAAASRRKSSASCKSHDFLEAFCDKGRLKPLLQLMPVRVIMNDQTALLGSARFAAVRAEFAAPWSG